MPSTLQRAGRARLLAWAAAPLAVAALTALGRWAGANAPTIGSIYLVAVLGLAAWGGWAVGATASVAAMLCFNYFFLPPLGTLTIAEPANWVALLSFLAASTFASRLVATARRQADEAQQRRRQVETLYDLCFGLFTASQRSGALGEAAARTLAAIEASAGVLLLGEEGEAVSRIGEAGEAIAVDAAAAGRARATHRIVEQEAGGGWITYLPLEIGGVLSGLLVARGALAPRAVLAPAGRLLALAVERERLLAESAHLVAMQESDTLKTSLLRAVSHDLRTPLTALRLEIESLDRHLADDPEGSAIVRGLSREQERLARRIDNLLSLARLEAGVARPHPEPVPAASLFRAARESLASILGGRRVVPAVAAGCPELWADPALALEVLVNLLENAARAAPPEEPLELAAGAGVDGRDAPGSAWIEVRDRGPGLPPGVRRLLASPRERRPSGDSGDSAAGGLGLQIARGLAAANGGALALLDREGGGTIARLTLPAAVEPIEPVAPAAEEPAP
jgi:two-component system sensor histidine kinase KdpD